MAISIEAQFQQELFQRYEKCPKYLIPKEKYYNTIEEVKQVSQSTSTKSRHEYYLLSKYEVLQCGDVEKLIKKGQSPDEPKLYYVTTEDTFDIIKRVHIGTGHGGRDRMIKDLQTKYANILRDTVELFKSLCQECQKKRKRPMTKGVVVKPILTSEFSSRGQVDLIDMQSMCQGSYKWIMVYQDHLTKFCILRPLTSKRAAEVAFQLVDIFLMLGAPVILQSDNGSEFTAYVIKEMRDIWPELTLVHGKPRHPQSQGSVERANGDIKDMLVAWMSDNKSQEWPTGIKFVQFAKNSAHHSGIKRSPYAAMFGTKAKVGLSSTSLPDEIIKRLQTEQDLQSVLAHPETPEQAPSSETTEPSDPETTEPSYPETTELDQRQEQIEVQRSGARASQVLQAERMVKRSRIKLIAGETGDNVAVPIPQVDRGRGDPRNILGVIMDRNENDQYTVATKSGILNGTYSRNQFDICPQKLLTETDINRDTRVSLREAVTHSSICGGQGFVKCGCSGPKKC